VTILTSLAARHPKDVPLRQLLTQALLASGQPEQAVQELEEARAAAPDDPELAFLLAAGHLRLKNVTAADALFATIVRAKPLAQTHVLIGRTYRDAGEYDRARTALHAALRMDPKVRRAHYYLGTVAVLEEGVVRLDEAIAEFQQELALAPADPVTNLRLGMALVEAQRPGDAVAPLEIAVRADNAPADAFHYMGRCRLALGRPAEAVAALTRALELSSGAVVDDLRLLGIHYLLGQAHRAAGNAGEAARSFAAAEALSAKRAESSRQRLASYMADTQDAAPSAVPLPLPPEVDRLAAMPAAERAAIESRVRAALARAALNVGIMHAQAERFARAADLFETAAAADPDFPQVQFSLGVAYFTAGNYDQAHPPLARVLAREPSNAAVRRMLAVASLHSGRFEQAASLLADDPARDSDPSLQYAYGLALVRSNQAALAEAVFSRLIATHGSTPEMNVVLGQAHAQQGDFDAAIAALQHALTAKPAVADASAALGLIYLRQGRLDDAASTLREGLKHHPADAAAAHTLATVLDLQGAPDDAIALLRPLLQRQPKHADARYLLGKLLLTRGAAAEAVEHLELAAQLAPEDANIHYQLAQAYRAVGRDADAQQRFEIYQQLKDKRRTR